MERKNSSRVKKTKELIIKSAMKLFTEKGYQSTTIREIAQLANVNDLTVYRHFQNKENLFSEMVLGQTFHQDFMEWMQKGVSGDYKEDLQLIYHSLENRMGEKADILRLLILESIKIESCKKLALEIKRKCISDLALFFEYYQGIGKITKEIMANSLASALYSFVFTGLVYRYFWEDNRESLKENKTKKEDELLHVLFTISRIPPNSP